MFWFCVISAAVAVAAGADEAQLQTGLALALCVVFHAGIVLLLNGVCRA
jgi:MFS superfamily sulfate permease-like transporter